MKKIVLLLSVVTLAFTSCSKNEDEPVQEAPTSDPNGILLTKRIYTSGAVSEETLFTYSSNKLVKVAYSGGKYELYAYTGNLITKIEYFNASSSLTEARNFVYDLNNKLSILTTLRYTNNTGLKKSFTYNTNGTISFSQYSGDLINQNTLYSTGIIYLQNGDVVRETKNLVSGVISEKTSTYDSMNSPFKNVLGFDKVKHESSLSEFGIFHNELTWVFTSTGSPTDSFTSVYTFNTNNFPISETETAGSNVATIQYTY